MRVALVKPYCRSHSWFFYSQGVSTPPAGMCALATHLRRREYDVIVLDAQGANEDHQTLLDALREFDPEVVGLSAFPKLHVFTFMGTASFPYECELAAQLRPVLPHAKVVLGGSYASINPEDALESCPEAECIVRFGDFDAFTEVLDCWKNGGELREISNVAFREGPHVRLSAERRPRTVWETPDLELLRGFPGSYGAERSLFLGDRPWTVRPVIPLLSAVGCPHGCSFCPTPAYFGRSYSRVCEPEELVSQVKRHFERYGVSAFSVWDDTFTVDDDYLLRFCDLLTAGAPPVEWWCFGLARWVCGRDDLLRRLARAGCRMMWVGEEVVAPALGSLYRKPTDFGRCVEVVERLMGDGIMPVVSWLFGNPWDGEREIQELLEQAVLAESKGALNIFTLLAPIPGTPLRRQLEGEGFRFRDDLRLYSGVRAVVEYSNIRPDRLEDLFFEAFGRSILAPRVLRQLGRMNFDFSGSTTDSINGSDPSWRDLYAREVRRLRNIEAEPLRR